MPDVLDNICAATRARIEASKKLKPLDALFEEAKAAPAPREFAKALRDAADRDGAAFIAEIKKASPSAGLLRNNFSPSAIARSYADAGAACLSVLTNAPYFMGKNEDLIEARNAVALPVLRKDFMLDTWQIAESRALGADCVLLIMAALDDDTAKTLCRDALDLGMDVLAESHTEGELARALALPATLIGVNSRNLKTMTTDLSHAASLVRAAPKDRLIVAESGLRTKDDISFMQKAGARGFLIGESLLRHADPGAALRKIRG